MYVIVEEGVPRRYTLTDLKRDNRNVSWPKDMTLLDVSPWGVFPLVETAQPDHDPATQIAEQQTPVLVGSDWTEVWSVRDLTAQEIEQRRLDAVPPAAEKWRLRLALHNAGLLDDIATALAASPAAQIEWDNRTDIDIDSTLMQQIKTRLGWTDRQLEDIFTATLTIAA